jgi:hypothetical protein
MRRHADLMDFMGKKHTSSRAQRHVPKVTSKVTHHADTQASRLRLDLVHFLGACKIIPFRFELSDRRGRGTTGLNGSLSIGVQGTISE